MNPPNPITIPLMVTRISHTLRRLIESLLALP
jgi:hypothetical protein